MVEVPVSDIPNILIMQNKYKNLGDKLETHLNDYLISHWSVSALECFKRNEKAFEKNYIYNDRSFISSNSTHVGRIYHECMKKYFESVRDEKAMTDEELRMYGQSLVLKIDNNQVKGI